MLHQPPISRRGLLAVASSQALLSACGGGSDAPRDAATAADDSARAYALAYGPKGTPFNPRGKGGLMIQTGFGTAGNFEVLFPSADSNLHFYSRNNDGNKSWGALASIGSRNPVQGASMIYSSYGNVDAISVDAGVVKTWFRTPGGYWNLKPALPVPSPAKGWPALIQSSRGSVGNFEAVVGLAAGGMVHFSRNNDNGNLTWSQVAKFGSGNVNGVSLMESNFVGSSGLRNFELLAWVDDRIELWWCNGSTWIKAGVLVSAGVGGCPAMIQSNYGVRGNFEVLVPLASGGIQAYSRNNDGPSLPWAAGSKLGTAKYRAVGFIQGYDGVNGNFECCALTETGFDTFWRDDNAAWRVAGPVAAEPIVGNPAALGRSDALIESGVTGINASLLANGKVLQYGLVPNGVGSASIPAALFDPASGLVTRLANIRNHFCSGQTNLPGTQVLIVGGHYGDYLKDVALFDSAGSQYAKVATMDKGRWYPTVVALGDGRGFIIGGGHVGGWTNDIESTWQTYAPSTGLAAPQPVPNNRFSPYFPNGQNNIDMYPLVYQLPDGRLFVHARNTTRFLTVASGQWSATLLKNVSDNSRTYPFQGGAAMLALRPGDNYRVRVLVSGGCSNSAAVSPGVAYPVDGKAVADCELLDLGAASPAWRATGSMSLARAMHDLVMLPDGTALAVGGSGTGKADFSAMPRFRCELYDPVAGTWTQLASLRVARGYHATALLLPDGRVAVMGKDGDFQPDSLKYPETRIELYSPPYLFKGARPQIASAPPSILFGQSFNVTCDSASAVGQAVLVRCGSTTHQNNFSQRVVELVLRRTSASSLSLDAPPNGNIAPPGPYMLFLMGTNGTPSVAAMLQLTSTTLSAAAGVAPQRAAQAPAPGRVSLEQAGAAPQCSPPEEPVVAVTDRPAQTTL